MLSNLFCGDFVGLLSVAFIGTIVGHVEAVYSEENETSVYSVQEDDGDGLFLLNPHSGEFLLSRALDFEMERYYILTAAAQRGDSELTRVRVYFSVIDVNDNPPVFSQNAFSASIPEDSPAGMCFLNLNVSDPDEGNIALHTLPFKRK